MKATDFCEFFEFTLKKKGRFDYVATDDHGTFYDRRVEDVTELADMFDSMLPDYVDATLEEYGFEYDENGNKTYYEQALDWIMCSELDGTDTHEIVKCLVNPELIEE